MTYGNRGIRNMAASGCYDAISSTFGQTSDSGRIWKILILEQCGHKRCISVWKDTMQRVTGASRGTSWRGGPELSPLLISTCSTIYQHSKRNRTTTPSTCSLTRKKFVRASTKAWKLCISDDACLLIRKPPPHLPGVSRGRLRCRLGYDCCLVLGELIFICWPWGQTLPLFGEGAMREILDQMLPDFNPCLTRTGPTTKGAWLCDHFCLWCDVAFCT